MLKNGLGLPCPTNPTTMSILPTNHSKNEFATGSILRTRDTRALAVSSQRTLFHAASHSLQSLFLSICHLPPLQLKSRGAGSGHLAKSGKLLLKRGLPPPLCQGDMLYSFVVGGAPATLVIYPMLLTPHLHSGCLKKWGKSLRHPSSCVSELLFRKPD